MITIVSVNRVATDHNIDNTTAILRDWLIKVQSYYHYVEWRPDEEHRYVVSVHILLWSCRTLSNGTVCVYCSSFEDELGPKQWNNLRYEHVMKLRQAALDTAREIWADYLLVCYLQNHPLYNFTTISKEMKAQNILNVHPTHVDVHHGCHSLT